MSYDNNILYNPEKHGVEIFHEIDTGGSYEFDKLVIFNNLDKTKLWYACDSGCSCPTPFEGFNSINEFETITKDNYSSFETALKNHRDLSISEFIEVSNDVKKFLKL